MAIKVVPTWVWLALIVLALAIGGVTGYKAGVNAEKADQLDLLVDADEQRDERDKDASDIGNTARAESGAAQVTNEGESNASQDRVRTVFRTVHVHGDCLLPAGVQHEVDAATDAANSAVRAAAGAPDLQLPDG